jgi:hypothetical protein
MKRKAYTSAPVPFSLSKDQYVQGKCDVVYIIPDPRLEGKGSIDVKGVVDYIASDDPRTKYNNGGKLIDMIPCTELKMSVDSAKVFQSDVLCKGDEKRVVSEIHWKLDGSYIVKNHLMVLDLLSNNDWSRPIYFAITVGSDNYFGLSKYFRQEGLAYRLVPFETRSFDGQEGEINTDIMYKNMMEKFKWGGLNEEGIYLDEGILRMASNFRNLFGRLAQNLIIENKKDSARKVLERCEEVIPNKYIPYNYFNIYIAESFIQLGLVEKGKAIIQTLARSNEQNVKYYLSIPPEYLFDDQMIVQRELGIAHELLNVSGKYKFSDIEASVANNTLLSIEKNYKFVFNYMNFAQNQEQLGQWYETLDDFEKNILALYVQIQQTKQKNIK